MAYRDPAPHNDVVQTFVTPRPDDIIFYEIRDSRLPENFAPDEYGQAHWDPQKFPGHKLVLIAPHSEDGWQKWYYAKDRVEQEDYNWQVTYPFNGLIQFPVFSCTYVFLRDGYQPIAKGEKHPLDLGDDTLEIYERFKGTKLLVEKQIELGGEISSLYIAVQRIYGETPTINEQLTYAIEREYPYGGKRQYPRFSRDLIYFRQDFAPLAKGTPDNVYTNALLIGEKQVNPQDELLSSLYVVVNRVYDELAPLSVQETYNAEFEYPYNNSEDYPRIVRTYTVFRADYEAAVALGNPYFPSTTDPVYTTAGLVAEVATRFKDPYMDSLYLQVTRTFDIVPAISDLYDYGYQILRPHGELDTIRLVWKFPIKESTFTLTPDLATCPIPGYTNLRLTDETVVDDTSHPDQVIVTRVYDDLPGPDLDTTTESRPSLSSIPARFIDKQTVIQKRQPVDNATVLGSTGGTDPTSVLTTVEASIGPEGQSSIRYSAGSTEMTVDIAPMDGYRLDPATGLLLPTQDTLVPAGYVPAGIDANGFYEEVTPLNTEWSVLSKRKASTLTDARSYNTIINHPWPAELVDLTFSAVQANGDLGDYTSRYVVDVEMIEAYNGPCLATVTEHWTKDAPVITQVAYPQPTGMAWDFLLSGASIRACLHPEITITESTGNAHPVFTYTVSSKIFAATNYPTRPASVIAQDNVSPNSGGYLRRTVEVFRPVLTVVP